MMDLGFSNVVHLIGHLRLGAGRYVVDLALEQKRKGLSVKVVVSPDVDVDWATDVGLEGELLSAGVSVVRDVGFFRRDLTSLLTAAGVLASHVSSTNTVTNAHSAIPAVVARWAGASTVIATCHGVRPDRPSEQDFQDALAYAASDAVTTPSRYWADVLRRRLGVGRPVVIPVGLDLGRYPAQRRIPGPGHRARRIVCVCELTWRKGVDILIGSMEGVWARFPKVELHVIGEGDQAARLREQASGLPYPRCVTFHGFVSDPYSVLHDFDLFALASRSDNMPVAMMEAMLAGLPVVATAVGGITETIEQARCGILAAEPTVESVSRALLSVLELRSDDRCLFAARGEEYARKRFSVAQTAECLAEVYRRASLARRLEPCAN